MSITPRVEKIRQNYINTKPSISYERANIWTQSFQRTEGLPMAIRTAQAFYDTCNELCVNIFEGELIVGASGEFRKCGILTPEFAWKWVDDEMDNFPQRPQDPYEMTEEQRKFVRENIFPYWKGKSVEDAFLARTSEETKKIGVDTGFLDTDSKWRNGIGEISPDYIDQLFPKGFSGIKKEAQEHISQLNEAIAEEKDKITFYHSIILVCDGIIRLANRYAEKAVEMAQEEKDTIRKLELLEIAEVCERVPENPPTSFREALQFVWFVQLGGIISENPLALNPGRFDQYMYPYYKADEEAGKIDYNTALELVECLWLKYSEWAWTISANTADFFAGYTNFENLTVGGTTVDGKDGTNTISYMAIQATKETKCHQPTLSCRIHPDCPSEFMEAVTELVSTGCGFPAIHSDRTGYQMLSNLGYSPEDAKDWNNCGCVVPHSRKTFEWTSSCNISFAAALEFALNEGKSRLSGELVALSEKDPKTFQNYEEVEQAVLRQFSFMVKHGVISLLTAQKIHKEQAPRPFLSACNEYCLKNGKDLVDGGAKYNIGPVFTGVGLSVTANSLAVIKKLVFEDNIATMSDIIDALNHNWEGYETLRAKAQAVPKYGNDDDYVDSIAKKLADYFYKDVTSYNDIYGHHFVTAFMGISNYLPTGKVLGATPDGRKAKDPINEGVSPYTGTDTSTCLAALRSSAKLSHDIHSGGTLLNLRLNHDLVATKRGRANLGAMLQSYFALGAFHVQFNTISNEVLKDAQAHPENYKDLLVRVAGYSTQFVNLSKSMQDSIMARNAHESF
ncbi:pyruvate formate lyase family protein [Clostridium sp. MD294]|uniref:glycyl radical protein n=1 Tax=Clostridium sp. MD294 TaxID=97138 RepID=UPI0002C99843|nr:pyruvate formate lyase family protein [Clostridium sp. MD294]NDO47820.1 formate C-acetyltransferase/glycerol dehydratase family glycyl radical enzyme [Clostridium sp. MD294]USF29860.1 Choline trimethylamine-lyase [Clostridium sp. MD294]